MNLGNRKRLKKAALELEQLAKGHALPEDAILYLMDVQEAIITVQRDIAFRPAANQPEPVRKVER